MKRIAAGLFFIFLFYSFGVILSNPDTLVYYHCGSNHTHSKFTYLDKDLQTLFVSLKSDAKSSFGFAKASVVDPGTADSIYGLVMCYQDVSDDDCAACLDLSTANATTLCPATCSAVFFYEGCFLRYEDRNFLFTLALDQKPHCINSTSSLPDSISKENTISNLVEEQIPKITSSYLYAYDNKTNGAMNYSAYALVQCTRDLSLTDCDSCLQYAVGNLSDCSMNFRSVYAKIQLMSCYVSYKFHALNAANYQPLAPPSTADTLTPDYGSSGSKSKLAVVAAICAVSAFFNVVAGVLLFIWKHRKRINAETSGATDFRVFKLSELKLATNNFSDMLGEGGFGPVFKGELRDGKQIAVKRLAGWSNQGQTEFDNEVDFLAKLRHKNLVKLLGYCLDKSEKLLCYEYLPSGSLDGILLELSWQARLKIIAGISSGLHYLHDESGLKIIHRDLKPSNILLDEDMNPKISDFGLARLYQDDRTHKETSIIAGTKGYMPPEYVMQGIYSEKMDVYAFGIMLLEIVTGRKHNPFGDNQPAFSLTSHAWQHWAKGEVEVLKDPVIEDVCLNQLSRCVHIGLLCVQEAPSNRPTMEVVNFLLRNDSIDIPPLPEDYMSRPAFLLRQISMSSTSNTNLTHSTDHSSSSEAPEAMSAKLTR